MWIRTQGKGLLVEVKRLYIVGTSIRVIYPGIEDDWDELGTYATEERAIQILDEIQGRLANIEMSKFYGTSGGTMEGSDFIYQMPAE